MKNILTTLICVLLLAAVSAQVPHSFNYQAVLRTPAGEIIAGENVTVEIRLIQGTEEGEVVFSEIHQTQTNDFGLINLQVGSVSSLEGIEWGQNACFVSILVDGEPMGTSPLLSVPFALHTLSSADAFSGDYQDLENTPNLDDFIQLPGAETGDMLVFLDDSWKRIPVGGEGQVLTIAEGKPQWADLGDNDNGDDDETGTVTDEEGNEYTTVKIGDQWWMAENLRTSQYNNGNVIPTGFSNIDWEYATVGAYSIYNNSTDHESTYGKLYNWKAVTDSRGICPVGWRIPSDEDWKTLEMYLGMTADQANAGGWRGTDEGGKLKITGTEYWDEPNTGATNSTGFSALAGGARTYLGEYIFLNEWSYFWSSTYQTENYSSWYRVLAYNEARVFRFYNQQNTGMSVRCMKDAEVD